MSAEKLLARLPKKRKFPEGILADDLLEIAMSDEVKADLLEALNSSDAGDVRLGFFFAKHLICPGVDLRFDDDLLEMALRHLKSDQWGIREGGLTLLILLGQDMAGYRDIMLNALRDTDPMVRKKALMAYASFAQPNEFGPLEAFETDDYETEVGMGSHLVYHLRNQALECIERVIGSNFRKSELTAIHSSGPIVFWWNWKPFHEWKKSWWRKLDTWKWWR